MKDIDTIIQVRYTDPATGKIADNREKEKLSRIALIFSILGIIPIIGLPFGITAIILGSVGLRKIKKRPERYSGEKTAKSIIVIGVLVTTISAIILIALAATGGPGQVSMGMGQ